MNSSPDGSESRPDRRTVLRGFAGAATAAATGLAAYRAAAEDQPLDALIGDTDSGQFGQDFDQASRTIHMPKPTAPTLSPATAQITEHAMGAYDKIVAQGGWPEVPKVEVLKLGMRNPSVAQLRTRLSVSGDLDPNATGNDIYDFYVEEAVRRFQARHGLTIDGIVREPTLVAMNVPAATRRDQLKVNIERLKTLSTNLGPRYVVANIPGGPDRGDRKRRRGVEARRGRRQARPGLTGHQQQDRSDQLQSLLDGAGLDRAQGPHSENAGPAGISHRQSHPHLRRAA